MKRYLMASMSLAFALITMTGCTTKYEKNDVKQYIESKLGIREFEILDGPVEVKGDDGYTDEVWTVKTDVYDLGQEVVFHVYNDYYYGMEWVSNRLTDDLTYQKQSFMLERYICPEGLELVEETDGNGRPWGYRLVYDVRERADFEKGKEASEHFLQFASAFSTLWEKDDRIGFDYRMVDLFPIPIDKDWVGATYLATLRFDDSREDVTRLAADAQDRYLLDCLEYGLLDRLEEFTVEERTDILERSENNKEVSFMDGTVLVPGLGYKYQVELGYGTIYCLLEQMGYEVEGDWTHFSFIGIDGTRYTYGYDLVEKPYESCETVDRINEITGLELDDALPMQEVRVNEDILKLLDMDPSEFQAWIESLDENTHRSMEERENGLVITGKSRQFHRLMKAADGKLDEILDALRSKVWYCNFTYDNLSRVYQRITIKLSELPEEELLTESIAKAAGWCAFHQILNKPEQQSWDVEVIIQLPDDSAEQYEEVYSCTVPYEKIDIGKLFSDK